MSDEAIFLESGDAGRLGPQTMQGRRCLHTRLDIRSAVARQHAPRVWVALSVVDRAGFVSLVRGDLSVMAVPLSDFHGEGGTPTPDFTDFEVIDHGRTLRFGRYEAAFDAVLYERDPLFRRKLNRQRLATDRTLGGSLRRLRKQRRLTLDDFGPLAKTVARIERGEVKRPRAKTLTAIASRLGVAPKEIGDF